MVDLPDRPAAPASGVAAPVADIRPASPTASSPANAPATPVEIDQRMEIAAGEEKAREPAIAIAEPSGLRPPFDPAAHAAGIDISDGLIAISLPPSAAPAGLLASIGFAPGSAVLPPAAAAHLERFLAEVKAPDARIKVVGEADTPALALDRALAVGLALVRGGIPADRLELTLASATGGDQVRLSAVASEP
jgi:outer membrane protein OmpA-like peptidoglycan-associated protein